MEYIDDELVLFHGLRCRPFAMEAITTYFETDPSDWVEQHGTAPEAAAEMVDRAIRANVQRLLEDRRALHDGSPLSDMPLGSFGTEERMVHWRRSSDSTILTVGCECGRTRCGHGVYSVEWRSGALPGTLPFDYVNAFWKGDADARRDAPPVSSGRLPELSILAIPLLEELLRLMRTGRC